MVCTIIYTLGFDCSPIPFESLGQLIKIIRESQMVFVVDKLIEYSAGKDEELRDISGLGRCPLYTLGDQSSQLRSVENHHCRTPGGG